MTDERRLTDPFKDDLHELVQNVFEMKETLVRLEEKLLRVDDHHKTLYGIGGNPGLTVVVDRLNEIEKSRTKNLGIIYTSIVGLSLKALWDALAGHR